MTTAISFIILLGVLIFVHELGHFTVGKLLGIKVLRFSLGFGPILWKFTLGETEYALSAFPLGGYVKFHGGDLTGEVDEEPERAFPARPVWERLLTVFAGPLMNFVLAVVILAGLSYIGTQYRVATVGELNEGLPAIESGIQAGDLVVAVDGKTVDSWDEMAKEISSSEGHEVSIDVVRGSERFSYKMVPEFVSDGPESKKRPVIGIKWSGEMAPAGDGVPLWRAPIEGVKQTAQYTVMTVDVVYKLITGQGKREEVGGPIAIAGLAGDAMRAGLMAFSFLMAILSINLGVINLVPIPILDGGLLLFFLIEWVRGKPVGEKAREIAQQVGFVIIAMLMIFLMYNDIARVIG
ncbi:MAG: RIP metalloprotease RseP [Deltaproteobacteria bacterium]|nr:MAG: RIP metalloprotease RseP [Deltaproteobacteria bacterium]